MRRTVAILLFLSLAGTPALAQNSVNVISGPPAAKAYYSSDLVKTATQISKLGKQISQTARMIENQAKAIKNLDDASLREITQAMSYQLSAIRQFNSVMQESTILTNIDQINQMVNSAGFQDFQDMSTALEQNFAQTQRVLQGAQRLTANAKERWDAGQKIRNKALTTQGIPGQMQLVQDQMRLFTSAVEDVRRVLTATNNYYAQKAQRRFYQRRMAERQADRFWGSYDESRWESDVSQEEVEDTLYFRDRQEQFADNFR